MVTEGDQVTTVGDKMVQDDRRFTDVSRPLTTTKTSDMSTKSSSADGLSSSVDSALNSNEMQLIQRGIQRNQASNPLNPLNETWKNTTNEENAGHQRNDRWRPIQNDESTRLNKKRARQIATVKTRKNAAEKKK